MKFKVGDKVRCIKNTTTKRDYGGGGYRLGLEFYINEILKASTDICYGGYGGMGVFEEYLELVEEKNDPKHFDQIITLEQWNEIVNGKQEKTK